MGGSRQRRRSKSAEPTAPNLFYSTPREGDAALRRQARFLNLPEDPQQLVPLLHADCSVTRFIRQSTDGSSLWDALHTGVLTTGRLKEALGFCEEHVARGMGCHQQAGHGPLVRVYQHLRKPPHPALADGSHPGRDHCQQPQLQQQQQQQHKTTNAGKKKQGRKRHKKAQPRQQLQQQQQEEEVQQSVDQQEEGAEQEAAGQQQGLQQAVEHHGKQAVDHQGRQTSDQQGQQAGQQVLVQHERDEGATAMQQGQEASISLEQLDQELESCEQQQQQQQQQQQKQVLLNEQLVQFCAQANAAARSAQPTTAGQGVSRSAAPATTSDNVDAVTQLQQERAALCQQAAAGGITSVRQAWGHTQESAALLSLLELFPGSVIQEAGLCLVSASDLPSHWQLGQSDLPLMGASPDAIIAHPVPLPSTFKSATPGIGSQQQQHPVPLPSPHSTPSQQQQHCSSCACSGSIGNSSSFAEDGGDVIGRHDDAVLAAALAVALDRYKAALSEIFTPEGAASQQPQAAVPPSPAPHIATTTPTTSTPHAGRIDPPSVLAARNQAAALLQTLLTRVPVRSSTVEGGTSEGGTSESSSTGGGSEAGSQEGNSGSQQNNSGGGEGAEHSDEAGDDGEEEAGDGNSERTPAASMTDPEASQQGQGFAPSRELSEAVQTSLASAPPSLSSSAAAGLLRCCCGAHTPDNPCPVSMGATSADLLLSPSPLVIPSCQLPGALHARKVHTGGAVAQEQLPTCSCPCSSCSCQSQGSHAPSPTSHHQQQHHHHQFAFIREAVEIKTSCPFDILSRPSGARGRVRKEWVVCDRGPRSHLSPAWVPQLQLHMAAAGTWSGLLVSRSPRGVAVYRMYRDDEYLYRMCCLIKRLYTLHCVPGKEPGPRALSNDLGYPSFLANTRRLASSAKLVAAWAGPPPVPEGVQLDSRQFV